MHYPKEKLIIVLAIEERAGKFFEKQVSEVAQKYVGNFYKFLVRNVNV